MNNTRDGITAHLNEHVQTFPDKIAFTTLCNEEGVENSISYSELASKVTGLAFQLSERRLKSRSAVLIYQDIMQFIISFLACQHAGVIPVPAPYMKGGKQVERLAGILKDAEAGTILCSRHTTGQLAKDLSGLYEQGKIEIISTDGQEADRTRQSWKAEDNEIALIQYTSGSTGTPKGVVITSRNLMHNQQVIKDTFGCTVDSVIFSWLPFHHDMGLIGNILHTVYIGCSCVLMSPMHFIQDPKRWLSGLTRYKATHSGGPDFAYNLCVNKISPEIVTQFDLAGWMVAFNGSEPVRAETIRRFSQHFKAAGFRPASFYPCYGLAEATLLVAGCKKDQSPLTIFIERKLISDKKITLTNATDPLARPIVSSGRVASGMDIKIISVNNRQECDELEEGEICISGDSVSEGYWGKDNTELFYTLDGRHFLRTGDLGFLYEHELFVHGRIKEMLIIRGKNIYPYDIEQAIAETHIAIEYNGVVIFSIDDMDDKLVVVAEIKRALVKNLEIEQVFDVIDKTVRGLVGISPYDIVLTTPLGIPRTTSGKLQRTKCRDNYQCQSLTIIGSCLRLSGQGRDQKGSNPWLSDVIYNGDYNTIKKYLLAIIGSKGTGLPDTLPDDRIELTGIGIDSLRASELINIVNRDLGIYIDVASAFRDNTLHGLITTIESKLWLKNKIATDKEITI